MERERNTAVSAEDNSSQCVLSRLINNSPPDYANRKWYDSQSSRVYDAIDVAHLQAAQEGHDSMFKMKIWDVSQNVDRFKTGMGLMPCITPGGCDFGSNRQDALNGSQTLVLQGMPLDKLHFAGETQRECQDLAGNAMSTTVIGASLISAIVHGHKALRNKADQGCPEPTLQREPSMQNRLVRASAMAMHKPQITHPEDINIEQLLKEARLASRLCACEGELQISEPAIKTCSARGHSACSMCASNPKHQYTGSINRDVRQQTPHEFVRKWKPQLPSRVTLEDFPDLEHIVSQLREDQNSNDAYVSRIVDVDVGAQHFSLSDVVRFDKAWGVVYTSSQARIELQIGDTAIWLLYVACPPSMPGNSKLRKALVTPVARAVIDDSLMDVEWELFIPSNLEHSLHIRGSAERSKSWRNKLGLPDYQAENVPTRIYIKATLKRPVFLRATTHISLNAGRRSQACTRGSLSLCSICSSIRIPLVRSEMIASFSVAIAVENSVENHGWSLRDSTQPGDHGR